MPALPTRGTTIGPAILGLTFSAILYGVTTVQIYLYYKKYPGDRLVLKIMVAILWCIDTLHVIDLDTFLWAIAVPFDAENPLQFAVTPLGPSTKWCIAALPFTTLLSDTIIRIFYCWRISILCKNDPKFTAVPVLTSLAAFAYGLYFIVKLIPLSTLIEIPAHLSNIELVTFILQVVADFTITTHLCYVLWRHRGQMRRTRSVIHLLMTYIVATGSLTSVCYVLVLIFLKRLPTSFVYQAIYMPIGKVYLNSVLITLNSRKSTKTPATYHSAIPLSGIARGPTALHFTQGADTNPSDTARTLSREDTCQGIPTGDKARASSLENVDNNSEV